MHLIQLFANARLALAKLPHFHSANHFIFFHHRGLALWTKEKGADKLHHLQPRIFNLFLLALLVVERRKVFVLPVSVVHYFWCVCREGTQKICAHADHNSSLHLFWNRIPMQFWDLVKLTTSRV